MRKTMRRRRGMSLVEVMVVIAIILTLMAMMGIGVMKVYQAACEDTTHIAMEKLGEGIEIYMLRRKKAPEERDFDEIADGALDGWGRPFALRVPGENAPYSIVSLGRDGEEGGDGYAADIVWSPPGH